jgi:hypothetical protein
MSISELTDRQLDNLEANYRRAHKAEGGKYTLSEVLLEKKRRKPSVFGVHELAAKIIELAALSEDGLVTYSDLWNAFRSDPWIGHKSLKIMANSLERVIYYCVTNGLPILTVLVVQKQNRTLSIEAINNIYEACRELGVDVGFDAKKFVDEQRGLSRAVVLERLPEDNSSA